MNETEKIERMRVLLKPKEVGVETPEVVSVAEPQKNQTEDTNKDTEEKDNIKTGWWESLKRSFDSDFDPLSVSSATEDKKGSELAEPIKTVEPKPEKEINLNFNMAEVNTCNDIIKNEEKKMGELDKKIKGTDLKIEALDEIKKELESTIKELGQEEGVSTAGLLLKLKDLAVQRNIFLNERSIIWSDFKDKEHTVELTIASRDRILNKFIYNYERALEPLNKDLSLLNQGISSFNLEMVVVEIKLKAAKEKLDNKKKEIEDKEKKYIRSGLDKKDIKDIIDTYQPIIDNLNSGYEEINSEKEVLEKKIFSIKEQLAVVDKNINQNQNKIDEFNNSKKVGLIKLGIGPRNFEKKLQSIIFTGFNFDDSLDKSSVENLEEKGIKTVEDYITEWNDYFYLLPNSKEGIVIINNFLNTIKLNKESKINFEDFTKLITAYFQSEGIEIDDLNNKIANFKEKLETPKLKDSKNSPPLPPAPTETISENFEDIFSKMLENKDLSEKELLILQDKYNHTALVEEKKVTLNEAILKWNFFANHSYDRIKKEYGLKLTGLSIDLSKSNFSEKIKKAQDYKFDFYVFLEFLWYYFSLEENKKLFKNQEELNILKKIIFKDFNPRFIESEVKAKEKDSTLIKPKNPVGFKKIEISKYDFE